jgi:hypothetical protein
MVMTSEYRSYLLRLWLESNDPPAWRAILESTVDGERHGFADLQELCKFIEQDARRLSEDARLMERKKYARHA